MAAQSLANSRQMMVVTGAASGIGRHLAGLLSAAGHALVLTDIRLSALEAAAEADHWKREGIVLRQLDVRDADAWSKLIDETVQRFGHIDVLWNVAGYVRPGYIHETTAEQVSTHLDTNAKGTIFGSQAAAAQMVRQGSGHIVNIASLAGLAPVSGIALYSASKFAVRGFSLALAHELRPHGVAVTVVCPDAVQTPMLDLQIDYPEAALTFSAPKTLTVENLCRVLVDKVLREKPLEVVLPRWRGWLAKVTNVWPGLTRWIAPRLVRQGLARQQRFKAQHSACAGAGAVEEPSSTN